MPETAQPILAWPALLSDKQLAAYLSLSRAMVWRMVSTGELPDPVKMPGRMTRWYRDDIDRAVRRWARR